jgi:hypothetical protein
LPDTKYFNFALPKEMSVLIQSVELVELPNAPAYQEKIYRARLASGEAVDLFQTHWDVPLPPESLVGLTIEQANRIRNAKMLAVAQGIH